GKIEPASVYATDAGRNDEAVVGLSCPSATFCAAVTAGGRAMTWNGSAWSAPVVLTPGDSIALQELLYLPAVTGVSCASPTFCMAVASNGDAYRYDGSAWSAPLPIDLASAHEGTHDGLTAVSCPSTTSCTATDDLGRVLTYDGTSWSGARRIDASLGLNAVSCTGPSFCVALDDLGEALVDRAGTWSGPAFVDP
ncbi:MAG TPA: hypothetical protein VMB72_02870, partial [Acidimicrobiales bacterium]|nr:hypothetical protein [Acidimicrobiales bacterium]